MDSDIEPATVGNIDEIHPAGSEATTKPSLAIRRGKEGARCANGDELVADIAHIIKGIGRRASPRSPGDGIG